MHEHMFFVCCMPFVECLCVPTALYIYIVYAYVIHSTYFHGRAPALNGASRGEEVGDGDGGAGMAFLCLVA